MTKFVLTRFVYLKLLISSNRNNVTAKIELLVMISMRQAKMRAHHKICNTHTVWLVTQFMLQSRKCLWRCLLYIYSSIKPYTHSIRTREMWIKYCNFYCFWCCWNKRTFSCVLVVCPSFCAASRTRRKEVKTIFLSVMLLPFAKILMWCEMNISWVMRLTK